MHNIQKWRRWYDFMNSTCENFDKIAKWYSKQWQKVPVSVINLYTRQKSWRSQMVNRQWMEIQILRRHFEWKRKPQSTVFTWPRGWQSSIFTCPQGDRRSSIFTWPQQSSIFTCPQQSSIFTWPQGQAVYSLHLTMRTNNLQSSPVHRDRQSSIFTWPQQSSIFIWPQGQAIFTSPYQEAAVSPLHRALSNSLLTSAVWVEYLAPSLFLRFVNLSCLCSAVSAARWVLCHSLLCRSLSSLSWDGFTTSSKTLNWRILNKNATIKSD